MEIMNFTRKELETDVFNHTGNYGYNNETDSHDDILFTKQDIRLMSDDDLKDNMYEMTSWDSDETKIVITDNKRTQQ